MKGPEYKTGRKKEKSACKIRGKGNVNGGERL